MDSMSARHPATRSSDAWGVATAAALRVATAVAAAGDAGAEPVGGGAPGLDEQAPASDGSANANTRATAVGARRTPRYYGSVVSGASESCGMIAPWTVPRARRAESDGRRPAFGRS